MGLEVLLFGALCNLLLLGVAIVTSYFGPVRWLWIGTGSAFLYGMTLGMLFPQPSLVKILGYGLLSSLFFGLGGFWGRYRANAYSLEDFLKKLFAKK